MDREVLRLLPFTLTEPFRGQLDKVYMDLIFCTLFDADA